MPSKGPKRLTHDNKRYLECNSTVGAVFLAMKAEYVVVAEQAHPLGPAYSIPCSIYRCRDIGLCVLLLLHAIIPCLCLACFYAFWHFHSYILQRFRIVKMFLLLFH